MLKRMLVVIAFIFPTIAAAGRDTAAVSDAVRLFAAIGNTLSQDSVEGIAAHAEGLLQMMEQHHTAVPAQEEQQTKMHGQSDEMNMQHHAMKESLEILAADGVELEAARAAYKSLSAQFVPMAQAMYEPSADDPTFSVMSCSMAEAQWIQVEGKVANPFYGSKMLRCGKKVANLAAANDGSESSHDQEGHMQHGGGHR